MLNLIFCLLVSNVSIELNDRKLEFPVDNDHWILRVEKDKTPEWDKLFTKKPTKVMTCRNDVSIYIVETSTILDEIKNDESKQFKEGEWILDKCYDLSEIGGTKSGWFIGTIICICEDPNARPKVEKLAEKLNLEMQVVANTRHDHKTRPVKLIFLIPKNLKQAQAKNIENVCSELKKIEGVVYFPEYTLRAEVHPR